MCIYVCVPLLFSPVFNAKAHPLNAASTSLHPLATHLSPPSCNSTKNGHVGGPFVLNKAEMGGGGAGKWCEAVVD